MNNKKVKTGNPQILALFLIAIIFIGGIAASVALSFNAHEYTITVSDKERVYSKQGKESSSKYLVFGDDENGNSLVFENTDNIFRFKFNSSNMQGKLKENHTYKITVTGIRVPIISAYENIIKADEVK